MTDSQFQLVFFICLLVFSLSIQSLVEKLYFVFTKKHYKIHHYSFSKFLSFILFPLAIVTLYSSIANFSLLLLFLVFAISGTIMEGLLGYTYDKFMGQRLWTYHVYSIGGYTSLLSLPLWGIAGVAGWLVFKLILSFNLGL